MFLLRMVKQAWTLVLPADWFLLRPLGSPGLCCLTGGTCMLWERRLLFPWDGGAGEGAHSRQSQSLDRRHPGLLAPI